jgi:hypothetical protein
VRIQVLDEAEDDLQNGRSFYDRQEPGIGDYFAAALAADIESFNPIRWHSSDGIRISSRAVEALPFGIYYLVAEDVVRIYALLHLRRDPAWIR